jgi:Helix-turn-helix domain
MTKHNNLSKRLLRVKPASDYLSISPGALRGLIQRGEIAVINRKDGLRVPWLVDIKDLDEWVESVKLTLQ